MAMLEAYFKSKPEKKQKILTDKVCARASDLLGFLLFMANLLKKGYLSDGLALGVVALSAASERSRYEAGLACLQKLGVRVNSAGDATSNYGTTRYLFSCDSVEHRARALLKLFKDRRVGAVLSVRGAYGTQEVLPKLNFSLMRKFNKPVIGFSDSTVLLNACIKARIAPVIHGPSLESAFTKYATDELAKQSSDALIALLNGESPHYSELNRLYGKGQARGVIIGGNLSCLHNMIGTPWEPSYRSKILFLEEVAEKPYRIHRMLLQLKQLGRLSALNGILLGNFTKCVHPNGVGPDLEAVLKDIFQDLKIPVYSGLSAGHELLNLPLVLGVKAQVSEKGVVYL
jgi:muramoyltetrapeptide carboxypeptidase